MRGRRFLYIFLIIIYHIALFLSFTLYSKSPTNVSDATTPHIPPPLPVVDDSELIVESKPIQEEYNPEKEKIAVCKFNVVSPIFYRPRKLTG